MKPLERIYQTAAANPRHIILPEGDDPRVAEAAQRLTAEGLARVTLMNGPDLPGITALTPAEAPDLVELSAHWHQMRAARGMTAERALEEMRDPIRQAAMRVRLGQADGTVGGAVETTSDTVRTALQIIGKAPGAAMVSSFFLMLYCRAHHDFKGAHIFADCGMVVDPDAREMAEIARASAASYKLLTNDTPRVAMLSFSTSGSASHPKVSKVVEATRIAQQADPDLLIDGELQFDAAFVPDVAAKKAADSPLQGRANVFVFPSLNAGNLGYKIAQRIGGAEAIGPVLQGLAKPANDLSRGCSSEDVLHMIAVTAVQAQATGSHADLA